MAILKWGAKGELMLLHRMRELFDDALAAQQSESSISSMWVPPCDIFETDDRFVLKAETPGVALDDIVLEIQDNTIMFSGCRTSQTNVDDISYHRVERLGDKFSRSFSLPTSIDEGKVSASLNDGVLTVDLPKKSELVTTVVEIRVE